MSETTQRAALSRVHRERDRQDVMWGRIEKRSLELSWPAWVTILAEEVGELAEAVLERDLEGVETEALHVAAVAVSIMEARMVLEGQTEAQSAPNLHQSEEGR